MDWNPNFPEVLGLEWLVTKDQKSRAWAGSPGRALRLRSTAAETITALRLSAAVDTLSAASVPTLIDVVEEGSEFTALPKLTRLVPIADGTNGGWTTETGATSNLFQSIDDPTYRWPNPGTTTTQWIQTVTPSTEYQCAVDAALFHTAGAAELGRIFWVGVGAILSANAGFRKMSVKLLIGGNLYDPSGSATVDVHGYGAIYSFWWGEINPATSRPWTPADIAGFRAAGTSRLRVRSSTAATADHFPRVHALSLNVSYLETENRAAVGVWRRPEDIGTSRLLTVTTDTLRTMPAGTANWSKATTKNYLYYWRQSISPSEYGPVVADDVRWNGAYQDLGSGGQPPGVVYPLSFSGDAPSATGMASQAIAYDQYGRPQETFTGASRTGYGLVMVRDDAAHSVDSQPYRLDLVDLAFVTSAQKLGQRLVPASNQTYLGVRFPVIPPATGEATLTVAVHRVSDGVQMGGTFTITASVVRSLRTVGGGTDWWYVSGFLSSGAALVAATAYELRFTTSAGSWTMAVPDCTLGPTTSFGGDTSGAFIGTTHTTTRDLCATLVRQPNPPTGASAAIINVAVTTYAVADTATVQHVRVTWTPPGSGMGSLFKRYELDRSLDAGVTWQRVAHLNSAAAASFDDHEVPRATAATYRIRALGHDGRFSTYATTGSVTPTAPGLILILTSNHDPSLEVAYLYDRESSYPILSDARDETVAIYGSDAQVVFMERENRGIGWHTEVTINQKVLSGRGGQHVLTPLVDLIRSLDVPYVAVLDDQGTQLLGHVSVGEPVTQQQPAHLYRAVIDVIPTHTEPVPVEVP